ncbi:CDP-glycerol glycerophosphotransferase family protein [Mycoplasma sp. P36-A1]|uniref:CDP-glycerol glycerophosphotransferase family protein n=1 Tax=Mycoplasma sp. P36-A1 TaxID=3252900 RepID=UPI003C2F0D79
MNKFEKFLNKNVSNLNSNVYTKYREYNIQKDVILYESFYGQGLTDNPYAIFLELLKIDTESKFFHVWVLDSLETNIQVKRYSNFKNIKFILIGSEEYFMYLATSEYIVINTSLKEQFAARYDQKVLQTWHGTPLKTLGKDIKDGYMGAYRNVQRTLFQSDLIVHPNNFTEKSLLESHDMFGIFNGYSSVCGAPRIDLIQNTNKEYYKNDILGSVINLQDDKKIAIYAPTWRGFNGGDNNSSSELIEQYNILKETIPNEYQLLLKVHLNSYKDMIEYGIDETIFIPNYLDTSEILSVTDLLVTDYSSIFFDYYVREKPIILWIYDKEEYLRERGTYFDLESIDAFITQDKNDLDEYFKNRLDVQNCNWLNIESANKWVSNQDGKVSNRIVRDFFFEENVINKRKVSNNKENILFFLPDIFTEDGENAIKTINGYNSDEYNIILFHTKVYKTNKRYRFSNTDIHQLFAIGGYNYLEEQWFAVDAYTEGLESLVFLKYLEPFSALEVKRKTGNIVIEKIVNLTSISKHWDIVSTFYKKGLEIDV